MRRAPTFMRSKRRQRNRKIAGRTGTVVVALIVAVSVASLVGSDDPPPEGDDRVSFVGADRGEGVPDPPQPRVVQTAAREIRRMLDQWYQEAFVDPSRYGDGSFDEIRRRFVGDAALGFVEDRDALTIGSFAPRIQQITVERGRANVTVYAEEGSLRYATAAVRFAATAVLNDATDPVSIVQRVNLVFEHRDPDGWVVTNYYGARQERRSLKEGAE